MNVYLTLNEDPISPPKEEEILINVKIRQKSVTTRMILQIFKHLNVLPSALEYIVSQWCGGGCAIHPEQILEACKGQILSKVFTVDLSKVLFSQSLQFSQGSHCISFCLRFSIFQQYILRGMKPIHLQSLHSQAKIFEKNNDRI